MRAPITLVNYKFLLNTETGEIETDVSNIEPDKFAKLADELDPKWIGGKIIPKAIIYICEHLKSFDVELERYMQSL